MYRPLAVLALAVLLAACGKDLPGGEPSAGSSPAASTPLTAPTAPAATSAVAIAAPADGSRLDAREVEGGVLSARTRVSGRAPAGSLVYLSANCRPLPCDKQATAGPGGRWSATLTLSTTRGARFVTIDAGASAGGAGPTAVTTVELVRPGARRAASPPSTGGSGDGPVSRAQPAPPPPPARTLPREVLVIGDSLAVGMADSLRAALPGWKVRIDADTGRSLAQGMRILAAERDPPAILALSLFTNDDPTARAALSQAVRATASRSGGCAVWATIVRPPVNGVSYAPANTLLERLAGSAQLALGLQLADWSGAVARSPSYLAPDGVHGTAQGYQARAQLYADAIRACAGA